MFLVADSCISACKMSDQNGVLVVFGAQKTGISRRLDLTHPLTVPVSQVSPADWTFAAHRASYVQRQVSIDAANGMPKAMRQMKATADGSFRMMRRHIAGPWT